MVRAQEKVASATDRLARAVEHQNQLTIEIERSKTHLLSEVIDGVESSTDGETVDFIIAKARIEVKKAVEEGFTNVDLDDLFATKGWSTSIDDEGKQV
jgi:hypothetical protein